MKSLRKLFVMCVGVAVYAVSPAFADVASPDARPDGPISMQRIGNPTWRPADFHVFSAPIGTATDGYAEFATTALAILPPPNHVANATLLVGPGAPHQPPYTSEFAQGLTDMGYRQGRRFTAREFSAGNAVWLVWMTVPRSGAAVGSSPDFSTGPIIPNAVFPIHVSAIDKHAGKQYSVIADTDVPALNAIDPPFAVDGSSHFPFYLADNGDFGDPAVPLEGLFSYDVTMTDAQGNGWHIVARFVLTSAP